MNGNKKGVTRTMGRACSTIAAPAMAAAVYACSSGGGTPPTAQIFSGDKDAGARDAEAHPVTMPILQSVDTTFLFADTADSGVVSSDGATPHVDPNLVNSWGLAFGPTVIA
jgi:hypothetical protein